MSSSSRELHEDQCADAQERSPRMAACLRWLDNYADYFQNAEIYRTDSVWTRRSGVSMRGLRACQRRGFIVSQGDDKLRAGGWRHDITPAGRALLVAAREGTRVAAQVVGRGPGRNKSSVSRDLTSGQPEGEP